MPLNTMRIYIVPWRTSMGDSYQKNRTISLLTVKAFNSIGIETSYKAFMNSISYRRGLNPQAFKSISRLINLIGTDQSFSATNRLDIPLAGIEERVIDFCYRHESELITAGLFLDYISRNGQIKKDLSSINECRLNLQIQETVLSVASHLEESRGSITVGGDGRKVNALIRDPKKAEALLSAIDRYREVAEDQRSVAFAEMARVQSLGLTRGELIKQIFDKHPAVMSEMGSYVIPLHILMEIANRYGDLGFYTQGADFSVTPRNDDSDFTFSTLAFYDYWRLMMGRFTVSMAHRFIWSGESCFNLVMIGDGSGQLGGVLASALNMAGIERYRLFHLDMAEGLLQQQREEYSRAGAKEVVSLKGSLFDAPRIFKEISGFTGGFFVLNEVITSLTAHSLSVTSNRKWLEFAAMYPFPESFKKLFSLLGGISAGDSSPDWMPLPQKLSAELESVLSFFKFYLHKKGEMYKIPFSVEYLEAIRSLLNCGEKLAISISDYGDAFIVGEPKDDLPMRAYGAGNHNRYMEVIKKPIDMTVDADPSLIYFARLFGGNIEFLGTMCSLMQRLDPSFRTGVVSELNRIFSKAEVSGYSRRSGMQILQDNLFLREIANPGYFSALITRGL